MALGQQNRYTTVTRGGAVDRGAIDAGLRQYMLGVYNYMWQGLLGSGAVAWIIATVPAVRPVFYTTVDGQVVGLSGLGMPRLFAPLIHLFAPRPTARNPRTPNPTA